MGFQELSYSEKAVKVTEGGDKPSLKGCALSDTGRGVSLT